MILFIQGRFKIVQIEMHSYYMTYVDSYHIKKGEWIIIWVPTLNVQCLENLTESGGQSVLTLGSLCLPCYMENTP